MTSIIYAPKKPVSIPLFNSKTNCYSVYFDNGEEVEIPAELFFKVFQQQEQKVLDEKPPIADFIKQNYTRQEIEKEAEQMRGQLAMAIKQSKMFGMTKEFFMDRLKTDPKAREIFNNQSSFDYMVSLTNEIWDED